MNVPKISVVSSPLPVPQSADDYRAELERLARAMSTGREAEIVDMLEEGSSAERLEWFVSGNIEKRAEWIKSMLPLVAGSLADFDELAGAYVQTQPQAAVGTGENDADAFLAWLEETQPLSDEERDYVASQRARHALEDLARERRLEHLQFQETLDRSKELIHQLGHPAGSELKIQLNPIHAWTTLRTSVLLGDEAELPGDVLFFGIADGSSAAALEPEARALVRELAEKGPWTLDTWACFTEHADRQGLLDVCELLAAMGVIGVIDN
jgi:hypothetical protein